MNHGKVVTADLQLKADLDDGHCVYFVGVHPLKGLCAYLTKNIDTTLAYPECSPVCEVALNVIMMVVVIILLLDVLRTY